MDSNQYNNTLCRHTVTHSFSPTYNMTTAHHVNIANKTAFLREAACTIQILKTRFSVDHCFGVGNRYCTLFTYSVDAKCFGTAYRRCVVMSTDSILNFFSQKQHLAAVISSSSLFIEFRKRVIIVASDDSLTFCRLCDWWTLQLISSAFFMHCLSTDSSKPPC